MYALNLLMCRMTWVLKWYMQVYCVRLFAHSYIINVFWVGEMVKKTQLILGFSALYRFCCRGVHCPSCPVKLYFQSLGTSFKVDPLLQINCEEKPFRAVLETFVQPGQYEMKVYTIWKWIVILKFVGRTTLNSW